MTSHTWAEGDIAFLIYHNTFPPQEKTALIDSNEIETGATGHPCVILKNHGGNQYSILTISGYGAYKNGSVKPPWVAKKDIYGADQKHFRAFHNSLPSRMDRDPLRLADGKLMPNPDACWVRLNQVYNVPGTVLMIYAVKNGVTTPYNYRMDPASLGYLVEDIIATTAYGNHKDLLPSPSASSRPGVLQSIPNGTSGALGAVVSTPITTPVSWNNGGDLTESLEAYAKAAVGPPPQQPIR